MPTIPPPPADSSGGFLRLKLTNGTDTHRMRIHVLPFSLTQFVVGGVLTGTDDGNHDYAYTGSRPLGSELGVLDTYAAFAAVIKVFWTSSWTVTLEALFQIQSGLPVEIFPLPVAAAYPGTSGGSDATGQARAFEANVNGHSIAGGKANIKLIGYASAALNPPLQVTPTSPSGSLLAAVAAYVSGADTGVVAHDGQKMQGSFHVTYSYNRRLRRHYGFA